MKSPQELIHWLELGAGSRHIRLAAVLLGTLALSVLVAWKQFHGATAETTLLQADVGRQLARGEGFTTQVNYPQAARVLAERGTTFDARKPWPELYQAPFYSLVIAGGLRLLPARLRESLFARAPVPPDGFAGDYFLLALNLALFWLAAWQTYDLGRRLFEPRVGWLAAFGVLLSVPLWQQVVALNGLPLLMVLVLAVFRCWWQVEEAVATGAGRPWGWLAGLGLGCGCLFLTEYSAGVLVFVVLGYVAWRRGGGGRWAAAGVVAVAFLLVTGPWLGRNMAATGNPLALAAQNLALKAGDPTASPEVVRATLSAEPPQVDLNKLGNKVLTSWQQNLQAGLWGGGAMWFMAFFAVGWLYAFRAGTTDRLRWLFTCSLAVLVIAQAAANSGESARLPAIYLAPLIIIFGAGFFFVLVGSNPRLAAWPRVFASLLLALQALPLLHDAMEPRRLHFDYPPYYPGLLAGMREELTRRHAEQRFGVMADVPAGAAWYGDQRVWAQPATLRDFYAITLDQPIGELLLTPHTLDRPFFSELAPVRGDRPATGSGPQRFGEWGRIYAGLMNGQLPQDFPLRVPQRLAENLYVLLNPALPPPQGK
jgi:hypothetical protein